MTVDSVVQLRVHGVSGTPPEAMLHYPPELIDQVSGDSAAGNYRRRDGSEKDAPTDPLRNEEAYSWGGLTSGKASRGLWLLFLPFILINTAHWMVPPAKAGSWTTTTATRASVRLLRLIGLSLTLTLMLATALLTVDLVGWQCAAMPHCGAGLGPLRFLVDRSVGMRLFWTSLPVAGLVVLLLLFGRGNPPAGGVSPPAAEVPSDVVPLEKSSFWKPDASVTRLRRCHVTVWLSGLACVVLFGARQQIDGGGRPLTWLLWFNAAIFAVAVLAVFSSYLTGRGGDGASDMAGMVLKGVQWLSVAALIAALVAVGRTDVRYDVAQPMSFPHLYSAIYLLLLVQAGLIVLLFVSTAVSLWWPAPPPAVPADVSDATLKGFRPSLRGFTAAFIAAIAWLAGGGFSAGVGLFVAQFLGTPVSSSGWAQCETNITNAIVAGQQTIPAICNGFPHSKWPSTVGFEEQVHAISADAPLIIPPAYFWAAVVFAGLLVVLVVIVLPVVWVTIVRPRTADALKAVPPDYPDLPPVDAASDAAHYRQGRERAIAEARSMASMTDLVPAILAVMTGLALLAIAAVLVVYGVDGDAALERRVPGTSVAVLLISAAAAALVAAAVMAYRNRQARRTVGIIWDVVTFWPRANHPLTPPCYAERAIPELSCQIENHMAATDKQRVIAATHSQGTIIGAATMLQLSDAVRERTALLTFGSPLRRLYGRNFPAYFGLTAMTQLHVVQPRWINMWVFSDPIGGWILNDTNGNLADALGLVDSTGLVDYRIPDAETLDPGPRDQTLPICAHSGYTERPEYRKVIETLDERLGAPPPPPDDED